VYCSAVGAILERLRIEEQIGHSLARRGSQVQTSTEIAQEIAAATDLDELFTRVVTLIKERFSYYHAQLFRYEPDQDAVVLLVGYGEIGQKMLAAGHQLQMGRGVVGTAAATGQSILAADVRQDGDWRPNPYLPDTRGELAVPTRARSGAGHSRRAKRSDECLDRG
jgi:GAF domain-containing protein